MAVARYQQYDIANTIYMFKIVPISAIIRVKYLLLFYTNTS